METTLQIAIKLGSLIFHYQEMNSKDGHVFDKQAIDTLENDVDVKKWFEEMNKLALLPVKRN